MEYSLLGPVEVRDGARVLDLGTPKQRALLALLAVHAPEAVPVDRVIEELWAGDPPARAEVSVRSYIANLRKALPTPAVESAGGGYRLTAGDDEIDARRFERFLAEARDLTASGDTAGALAAVEAGLALWRGSALADIPTPAARAEATRLEELRLAAVEERFSLLLSLGRGSECVAALEREVATAPLREGLHALLMRALHATGRSAEALAVYRAVGERLADSLGLDPSPALRDLAERIAAGEPVDEAAPAAPARPPVVGRDEDLACLRDRLEEARRGHGQVVLISGEPGIGKTRVLEEVAASAPAGMLVLWARCFEAGDAPAFWPWAQVVEGLARAMGERFDPLVDGRTADAATLLPGRGDGEAPPALQPDAARFQRYDAVATLLARAAAERPVVVLLDDAQWADTASLRLLDFLARTAGGAAIAVLVTYRTDDAESGALREVLAGLGGVPAVSRLVLPGLDETAVGELVAALGRDADPARVAEITARSAGNPFFVTELARLEGDDVPAGVRDVVARRLSRLSARASAVLVWAAVAGREFDLATIEAADGGPDALDAVEEAVRAGLVVERGRLGRYAFAHAIVRDVVYGGLSALRRARMHARLLAALDTGGVPDDVVRLAELARHAFEGAAADAAVAARAAELAVEGARRATASLAHEDAAEQYERAVAALDAAGGSDRDRAAALVGLSSARRAAGDPAASRDASLRAAEVARRLGDATLVAEAALGLALPGAVIGMDFGILDRERISLLQEALALLPEEDSPLRVRVLVHLALALYLSVDRSVRDRAAAGAVAMADRLGDPALRAAALAARHSTMWGPVPLAERIRAAEDLVAFAEEGGARQTALEGHIALAIDLLEAGEVERFAAEVEVIDDRASALRQPFYAWYSGVLAAALASMQGRYSDAERHAAAAREAGGVALGRRAQWGQVGWQYVTWWDTGRLAEAEAPLRALVSAFPEAVVVRVALAHVLAERGRSAEAAELAAPLLADPAAVPHDAMWLLSLTALAEVVWLLDDAEGAASVHAALAPAAGRVVVVGSGVAACGAVDRSLGLAALTAGDLDAAAAHLEAALGINERIGARPWAARTRGALAALLVERGRPGDKEQAAELLAAARSEADGIGAAGVTRWLERIGA